jgi:hypothetical protein
MKKLLFVVLPLGLALLAGILITSAFHDRGEAAEVRAERLRFKREFDERAALARAIAPDRLQDWREESNALLRGYFQAVAELRNRFPRAPAAPTALEAARAERKGDLPEKDRATLEDFQKYADARLALLQGGAYTPGVSAVSGGLRLDLLTIEPGASPSGGPGLRIEFALWGAPRILEREKGSGKTITRTVMPLSFRGLQFRFLDAAGKAYGEMNGPGEPYQKLLDPERFAPDFPPGVLFGTWWVELLPREAAIMELRLDVDVRGASGTARPEALGVSIPVQEPWRIPPGTSYQAEVREVAPAAGK